jgi:hypothetical protein
MNPRLTYEQVYDYLLALNFKLLDDYFKNMRQSLNIECLKCCTIFHNTLDNIKNKDQGCRECLGLGHIPQQQIRALLLTKNIIIANTEKITTQSKLELCCLICNYEWPSYYANVKKEQSGCPKCKGKAKYRIEEVRIILASKNIGLKSNSYINNKTLLDLECLICKYEWQNTFKHINNRDQGCPECNKYKNEKLVGQCLRELLQGIEIVPQYKIIRNQNYIRADYYFKRGNKEYIVEYNGGQHYKYIPYFHRSKEKFEAQKIRDRWLKSYCRTNKIALIVIDGRKYEGDNIMAYLANINGLNNS